jgi:hypothetical protein
VCYATAAKSYSTAGYTIEIFINKKPKCQFMALGFLLFFNYLFATNYLAKFTARFSRITVTLICPGYVISV